MIEAVLNWSDMLETEEAWVLAMKLAEEQSHTVLDGW